MPPTTLLSAEIAGLLALAAVAWVSLFFVAQDLYRDRARLDRRDLAAVLGLFLAAVALRWTLPLHLPIHENKHGYLVQPYLPLADGVAPHDMVSGHRLLIKLYTYLGPLGREPAFEMNVLFSALAVAGMYTLARALFGSRLAAWSAGTLLLFQPLAIMMAPTEEYLVSTSGLCLAGLSLLWIGARDERLPALLAGAALVGLGASAREITMPLSVLVPVFFLAATPPGRAIAWRRGLLACAVVAAGLAPIAAATLAANRAHGGAPAFIGWPHWPFGLQGRDRLWVGWQTPYIPTWMGWLAVASIAALAVHARRSHEHRRASIAALIALAVAQGVGSLVTGWFPSILRHQLFAMALLALPSGWLIGRLDRVPRARALAFAIVPALGAVTLLAAPEGYFLDTPQSQEYRFFQSTIARLPPQARAVLIPREGRAPEHLPVELFWVLAPEWDSMRSRDLPSLVRQGSDRPVYLFLDRTCFMRTACIDGGQACQSDNVDKLAPTPYGQVHERCEAALRAAPWTEVARRQIQRVDGLGYDLPSVDPVITLAVLMWDGRPPP